MRVRVPLMILGVLLAGFSIARAETPPSTAVASHLTIIPAGIEQVEVVKINTGRKAVMKDGQAYTVYETLKPGEGNLFLEISVDVSVDPGPMFLETSMIRLEEPSRRTAARLVPVYWYLDSSLEPAGSDSLTIRNQARLGLTFETPVEKVDSLTLWIAGLRVAGIPEIRELRPREGEGR